MPLKISNARRQSPVAKYYLDLLATNHSALLTELGESRER